MHLCCRRFSDSSMTRHCFPCSLSDRAPPRTDNPKVKPSEFERRGGSNTCSRRPGSAHTQPKLSLSTLSEEVQATPSTEADPPSPIRTHVNSNGHGSVGSIPGSNFSPSGNETILR